MGKPRFKYDHRSKRLIPIQEMPYGSAQGSNEFSNRGLPTAYAEVTCWPKAQHYRLTTGEGSRFMGHPDPVNLTAAEKQMCAILGLNELELGIFLRSWEPKILTTSNDSTDKRPEQLSDFKRALILLGKDRK